MPKMYKVQIKPKCRHGRLHADYVPKTATGNPGPYALAGEIIDVTQAELDAFGDKFILLDPVSAVLSEPNGSGPVESVPPTDAEVIEFLRAQLESQQEAHEETALELNEVQVEHKKTVRALQTATEVKAKPPARRGRPKAATGTKKGA